MAWSGADLALAHGNHCDPAGEPDLPEPGCNINGVTGSSRYFASQFGNNQFPTAYSNGIRGYLSVADVSMRDFFCNDFVNNQNLPGFNNPKCDFLLNGLVMTTWQNDNFAQIAFVEGAVPWPPANFNSSTPKTCD